MYFPNDSAPIGAVIRTPNKNRGKTTMMIIATITNIIVHNVQSIFLQ